MNISDKKLLADFVASGRMTDDIAADVLREQGSSGLSIGRILLSRGLVSEEEYGRQRARQIRIPFVDVDSIQPDPQVVTQLSEKICIQHTAVALDDNEGELLVALENPADVIATDEISREAGRRIQPALGSRSAIMRKIAEYQDHFKAKMVEKLLASVPNEGSALTRKMGLVIKDVESVAEEDSIIRIVNLSILQALMKRASDIHFLPGRDKLSVLYRVDGVLKQAREVSMDMHPAIINRIKIMSKLDISEKRLPQDGAFHISIEGRDIDFRVATTPTSRGEKIVLRILDKGSLLVGLGHLGFSESILKEFRTHIFKPHGIILIVGPTGSGKTTTLYSALESLNTGELNITTLEDPVEYQIDGLTQIQMHSDIGLDFASALRSVLRQDPDVILVGEIRDLETSRIAIQASLTGHLVFGTLHTNDAASAVTRLVDMGAEPYLIASSLRAVVSQRLVRMICSHCKGKVPAEDLEKKILKRLGLDQDFVYRGAGCLTCFSTGYQGRTVISELLSMTDALRTLITKHTTSVELAQAAQRGGMKLMFEDGLEKVRTGITTLEQLLQVSDEDQR